VTVGVIVLVAVSVVVDRPESEEFVLELILPDEDIVGHRLIEANTE
jgi:hypothetical protein